LCILFAIKYGTYPGQLQEEMNARVNSQMQEIKIEFVDPLVDPGYARLIEKLPTSLFHSGQWLSVFTATYQFKPEAIMVYESGLATAALPFIRISDPGGKRICALPFSDYCDPAFSNPSKAVVIFEALKNLDPESAVNLRLLDSPDPPKNLGFNKIKSARWHGLDLSLGMEQLNARLKPNFRRDVQKARNAGVKIRHLEREELRLFFELHLRVRKNRHRILAQPFSFFENIWDTFMAEGQGFFLGAFHDHSLIAVQCYIPWKRNLVYKYSASDYLFQQMQANKLLSWTAVEEAVNSGFSLFDLGLSDDDQPGLIAYKLHLGAHEKEIRFFNYTPASYPVMQGWKEGLKKFTDAVTAPEVSDRITEEAGNILCRFFA